MRHAIFGLCALTLGFSSPSYADETRNNEKVYIIGRLNDGSLVTPKKTLECQLPPIAHTMRHELDDCTVICHKLVGPPTAVGPTVNQGAPNTADENEPVVVSSQVTTVFSVKVIDEAASRVSWKHNDEEYAIWSNIDWNCLTGFTACRSGETVFNNMMLLSNAQSNGEAQSGYAIPDDLPKELGQYVLIKGNPENAKALEAVKALHRLYQTDHKRLGMANKLRKKKAKERKRKKAEARNERPEITLHYWEGAK